MTLSITYRDGARGTATLEMGRHGSPAIVLRRGFPVAAEVVAGIKADHLTRDLLDALGVADSLSVLAAL